MPLDNFWNPSQEDRQRQSALGQARMATPWGRGSINIGDNTIWQDTTTSINPNNDWTVYRPQGVSDLDLMRRTIVEGLYPDYGRIGEDTAGASEKEKNKKAAKILDSIKESAHNFIAKEEKGDVIIAEAEKYRSLGLEAIAKTLEAKGMKAWKEFQISAAGYKRINHSELSEYRKQLDRISDIQSKRQLQETPLEHYIGQHHREGDMIAEKDLGVPPADVLEKLKIARDSKLFDAFSVLHIKYVPDPILCGKIKESNDLYFIAEWGDDVKLTDIVK